MVSDEIAKIGIVPVVAVESVDDGLKLCETLVKSGLSVAEITFRTKAAAATIAAVAKELPELILGAGTVLNIDDLDKAFDSGARFAVSPGTNPKVVSYAMQKSYDFFPGISSPSDFEVAADLGVRTFKFFPAEAAGGIKMLKSLIGPYRHLGIKFCPTGGINENNMLDYLSIPEVFAIGGSWMVKPDLMGHWDLMAVECRKAVEKAKTVV